MRNTRAFAGACFYFLCFFIFWLIRIVELWQAAAATLSHSYIFFPYFPGRPIQKLELQIHPHNAGSENENVH